MSIGAPRPGCERGHGGNRGSNFFEGAFAFLSRKQATLLTLKNPLREFQ